MVEFYAIIMHNDNILTYWGPVKYAIIKNENGSESYCVPLVFLFPTSDFSSKITAYE